MNPKVVKFRKVLDKVDMGQLGDDRDIVEKELKVLGEVIQAKLADKV